MPSVRAASFERNQPLGGARTLTQIRPSTYVGPDDLITYVEDVGPRYFETLGMRLVAGRDFRASDRSQTPKVIALNESAARALFPGQNPIGRRVGGAPGYDTFEVVGVVADARHVNLREAPTVMAYRPALQDSNIRNTSLLIRTADDPTAVADTVRRIVTEIEPAVPVMSVTTLEAVAARSLMAEWLTAALASVFGILALAVATAGLCGLLLFGVAQRTREIGVRMALGASTRAILAMVLRESTWMIVLGVVVGLPIAALAARLAPTMLFGLSPSDPWTMAGAVFALLGAGVLAALWPARRATRVSPLIALRAD